jgi:hypothetical protein
MAWRHPVGGNTARFILLSAFGLVLGLALAACTSDSKQAENPNIVPTNYKQEILNTMTSVLADPTNVRDAFITDPALAAGSRDQRYTVCVRSNGRNANRQYMGSTDRIAYFYGGHLNQLIEATKEQCGNAAYKPFPELEKLCLANKCD